MDVYSTAASALDKLVTRRLQPDADFLGTARRALGALDAALRERGSRGGAQPTPRVLKTAKGGSYGRGTALRGGCDSELVFFLDCFKSYEDQRTHGAQILHEMRPLLDAWWQDPVPGLSLQFPEQTMTGGLQFRLASVDLEHWMDVNLVPAFDALGQLSSGDKPKPQVYSSLIRSGSRGGEHAACFTELRRNFVNRRPAKLKNLILLVKHWYSQVHPQEAGRGTLLPVYALELLTIFAWEQGCGEDAFSLAQGLQSVLGLIQQYQNLCVFWTVNYGFEDPEVGTFLRTQLERPRPIILDPADPTWDVGNGATWHWDVLAREAKSSYDQLCFLQAGDPVQPWKRLALPHPIQRDPDQGGSGNSKSLSAVSPKAGGKQLSRLCSEAASIIPSVPDQGPSECSKSLEPGCPGARSKQHSCSPTRPVATANITPSVPRIASDLSQVPTKELDRFIQNHLKPSPQFQEQVKRAIDSVVRCLRESCVHKPSRVSKGGSFGRGTDLRGSCDLEIVVFFSCLTDFQDQEPRADILRDVQAQLESWGRDPVPGLSLRFPEQNGHQALQFQLLSTEPESRMDVSLVPAFDAMGSQMSQTSTGQLGAGVQPKPQVYSSLIRSSSRGGEHAACFTELRRNFVNSRPAKLKNLILLVKHWYRHVVAQNKEEEPAGASLPPAYALELLTIFAWEQGCGKDRFNMAQGLRTVLGLVQKHQQLCVYWTVNYGIEDHDMKTHLLGQLRKPRPLVLDPADPTWNVGQGSWELLAQEAAALESQACLMNADGTPVQPWDVMPALLHQTPAGDLDKFIAELLQPNRQFLAQVNKAVNTICSFLRENCFRGSPIKVLKVVKGGSLAKGTALRGCSDADIVVFLSCFSHFSDQGSRRAEIISEIRAQLEACQQEQQFEVKFELSKWENPRVLHFSLTSQTMLGQSVDFDVLPAYDALGGVPGRGRTEAGRTWAVVEVVHCTTRSHPFTSQVL
ncbi:2'-5'-oligoadenylate synthase 3 isoform X3 [Castor canadensis]|uniref:2'-5'-oligoadenylate synthase 3 isoform X3 n=1 Tax=Castor canadensis TaxID=51338 RepID=A0AC58LJN4_CASCN